MNAFILPAFLLGLAPQPAGDGTSYSTYRAVLKSPGGELPFTLRIGRNGDRFGPVWIVNEPEHLEVPKASWDGGRLILDLEHYDSKIIATKDPEAIRASSDARTRLLGKWKKRVGKDEWAELDFVAEPDPGYRFQPMPQPKSGRTRFPSIAGRWSVRFSESDDPAVGIFQQFPDGAVRGTFLTSTGDYRYLSGTYEYGRLRLSCFDGAHAFLFDARLQAGGVLQGMFWSRDNWQESWTARRDRNAKLPDGFKKTKKNRTKKLGDFRFPDLDGTPRSLDDPAFSGRARIIEVFGSWCPNCNDSADYLAELHRRYRDRGLSVLGLAFEVSGDFNRDAGQVRTFAKRHRIEYPILVAGLADKRHASRSFRYLDRVRAYPTTIFLRGDGSVHSIHTGFSGPAAEDEHRALRGKFERIVEELLSDKQDSASSE